MVCGPWFAISESFWSDSLSIINSRKTPFVLNWGVSQGAFIGRRTALLDTPVPGERGLASCRGDGKRLIVAQHNQSLRGELCLLAGVVSQFERSKTV